MSRTYRKHLEDYEYYRGEIYHWKEWFDLGNCGIYGSARWFRKIDKKCRDKKPWDKPTSEFKKMKRRIERAKIMNAIRNTDYDNIPTFKTSDQWDWT